MPVVAKKPDLKSIIAQEIKLHQQSKAEYGEELENLSDSPFDAANDEEHLLEEASNLKLEAQEGPMSIHMNQEFTLGQQEDKPEMVFFSAPANKPPVVGPTAPPILSFQPLSSGLRYSEGS